MKRIFAVWLVLMICAAFLFGCEKAVEDTNAEKDTEAEMEAEYWLCGTGIPDGPDYTGGICKVYFKQDAIVLEGNLLKSISQGDYEQQIGTVETYDGRFVKSSATPHQKQPHKAFSS